MYTEHGSLPRKPPLTIVPTETIYTPIALSAVLARFARSEPRIRRAIGCALTFSGYYSYPHANITQTTIKSSPPTLIESLSTRNRFSSEKNGRYGCTQRSMLTRKSCSTHDFLSIVDEIPLKRS